MEESDSGVGDYDSEHSPGQLSALIVSDTDLSSSVHDEEQKATSKDDQSVAEEILPKEDQKESIEGKKEVKLIRFNVPYIQSEIQSLTPRKNWEIRVADLESKLEFEKRQNTELNKKLMVGRNEIFQMQNEYDAKLLNMRNDSSLAEARREAANQKIRLLEKEKDQMEKSLNDTITQHKSEVSSMEMLITSQKNKLNELSKELLDKTKQVESLTMQNARLVAKVEESAETLTRTQRHYDELVAKLTEEKRAATATADSQGTKLIQVLKESKYNLSRYQQCSDELNELKESLETAELNMRELKEDNSELRIKLRVNDNTIESLSAENEELRKELEKLKARSEVRLKEESKKESKSPLHVMTAARHLVESRRQEENLFKEKELMEIRETINKIEREKSISCKQRAAFEEELINERAASAELLKNFQEYKRKAEAEIDKLESKTEQQQKELHIRDIEIIELKTKLEDTKTDSLRYKEVYAINSYLRNLPNTGLWLSNKDMQEGIDKAKKGASRIIDKERNEATIKHYNEETETLHEDNKETLKKRYIGKANEVIARNNREIEDELERMEENIELAPVKSYLTELNSYV